MDTVKRLQKLLKERNMKISALAKIAGLGRTTLQTTIARGGQLSVDSIERICSALNISLAEFFTEPNKNSSDIIASDLPLNAEEIRIIREIIKERTQKNN